MAGRRASSSGATVGVENHDRIHGAQGGEQAGPLGGGQNGPAGTFQGAHRLIIVDGHDEAAAQSAGGPQIAEMADMKNVKTAIGQHDGFSQAAPFAGQIAGVRE